jgi:hypothetical protein
MRSSKPCPVCGAPDAAIFLSIELPVNCSTLFRDRNEALAASRGTVALAFCDLCGMIFNSAFEPALLEYDGCYENSLNFSPAFQAYCRELADRLMVSYDLREKVIIEVGCGDGEFLAQLCESGRNRGFGFDPAFTGASPSSRVQVFPELYSAAHQTIKADAVCCRHVLEHIPDPCGFLRGINANLANSPRSLFYCETPNAAAVLTGSSLWDVIYPHCSYFTPVSIKRALEQADFEVLRICTSFEDQFLAVDAIRKHAVPAATGMSSGSDEVAALHGFINQFADRFRHAMEGWAALIENSVLENRRIALWGAGAKAVTFLNMVPGAERIGLIVDSNPRKSESFIPCTGHFIASPASLIDYRPDVVILLNAAYEDEVRRDLDQLVPEAALCVSADGFPSELERSFAA